MNFKTVITVFMTFSGLLFVINGFAENPVVQTNFTPDPAPMVYNDTVFLFTGHDEDYCSEPGSPQFCLENYLLYTSTDLVNWTDHGIVASLKNFSWAPNNGAWASQCVHRNGKFYYYISVQGKGIGVLVADSPYGPFKDPLGKPLFFHSWNDIDPTVFIDDDGQAYMYWGNPECYWVKLNEDMISLSGDIDSLVPRMRTYQEGPWFYKREGRYYLAWSSTCCPEGIGYAMSDSPTGPWTYKGSIMDGNQLSPGNQPGIFDYKGKSYTFGFNFSINHSLVSEHSERRSACLAEMPYNADGTISKLPWFGDNVPEPGVAPVGTLNPYDTIQAETICFAKRVRTEPCQDVGGTMNVDSIHNGDYIKVREVDFGKDDADAFEARVASATGGGSIELHLDSESGPLAGTCIVTGTGGWQTWKTVSCDVSGVQGVHDLFFKFTGGSGLLFNFNWWKFTPGEATAARPDAREAIVRNVAAAVHGTALHCEFSQSLLRKMVTISLFDMAGRRVARIFNARLHASQATFPLKSVKLQSGVYFVNITVNRSTVFTETISLH
jgi:arabinoxylan arabinofuranohydrolase